MKDKFALEIVTPSLRNICAGVLMMLVTGSAHAFFFAEDGGNEQVKETAASQPQAAAVTDDTSAIATGLLDRPVPQVRGPKRVVSVGKFTSIGAMNTKYGSWDVGGGLAAMLVTALQEADRFIVVERANLQSLLTEQEMRGNKVTSGTGPELGKMLGVQLLVLGSVTEFGTEDEGGGFSLGLGGFGLGGGNPFSSSNKLSAGVSRQNISGSVAMDVRIVDTTTGRVLQSFRVSEKIDNSAWDFSVGYEMVNVGTNSFVKTPLGAAARKAVNSAVQQIAITADENAWQGRVVDFDQNEVYINAGSKSGLKKGDAFTIERVVKRLTDPETNEVLMVRKQEIGVVEIEEVQPKVAVGNFQALGMEQPQRGDFAIMIQQ